MSGRVHIVGAGLSGLSAAVNVTKSGAPVTLYEASGRAGGRCRSYFDKALDREIDNGNHLVLSGNFAVFDYLEATGATQRVVAPAPAEVPFLDLADGARWSVRPDRGRIPWSWLSARRRVPGATVLDYLRSLRLMRARDDQTIEQVLPTKGPLWDRFWAPFIAAVTNTDPAKAAAGPMGRVVRETLAKGEAACRPVFFPGGLSRALVAPALDFITEHGGEVRFNHRLRRHSVSDGLVAGLEFGDGEIELARGDAVVCALPSARAAEIIAEIDAPDEYSSIVNGHFRLPGPISGPPILGLVNATAEWLFFRSDVASATVSAAGHLVGERPETIAEMMWKDISRACGFAGTPMGPFRIVKERRATFLQTPAQLRRRAACRTRVENLFLAGDWTATGLPATIEGSIRSGVTAAREAVQWASESGKNLKT